MTRHHRIQRVHLILLAGVIAVAAPVTAQPSDQQVLQNRIMLLPSTRQPTVEGAPIAAVRGITELYEQRNWEPAWTDPAMISQLFDQVLRSVDHGLSPDDFHARQLGARINPGARANDPVFRADTEILCTDALARLAFTLHFGKLDPSSLDPTWNLSRTIEGRDPVQAINDVLDSGQITAALEDVDPNTEIYDRLRDALTRYRGILIEGGWPAVPDGAGLKLGSTGPRMVTLRERLRITGDLATPDPADPEVYDAGLESAVRIFQRRHGIDADGKVGPRSLEELNLPVEARIDQIRASLERLRWVFRDIEDNFIVVDIAGFRLYLIQDRDFAWTTPVQVGKPYHATPVFKSTLKYLEFNPTWTIPPGILRNETLPAIRKDPSYLSRNNMSVVTNSGKIVDPATIDWAATANKGFPYMIRQEPGTRNALGQVKFIFPNPYMVYLHDTPSKGLFARTERAFSHGCIRTQNPFDLAELLLAKQGWDRARIDQVVESRKITRVNLDTPMTVMLLYFTALVDPDGTVNFRNDVYERDARVIKGLDEPFRIDPPEGIPGAVDSHGTP